MKDKGIGVKLFEGVLNLKFDYNFFVTYNYNSYEYKKFQKKI